MRMIATMKDARRILVWDLPTRVLHWALAASVGAALVIGFLADDDDPVFRYHMLFGIVALFLVALRVLWGLVGSRHSRFSEFPLHPRELAGYLGGAVFAKTRRYPGNNPGSAAAAVAMFVLIGLLFASGAGLGGEALEEAHETMAWALLATVCLHLAGIAWHTIRHRENIALSMITGNKAGDPRDAITSARAPAGLVLTAAAGAWIAALFYQYDPAAAKVGLPLTGASLQLGENESDEHEHHRATKRKHRLREDDD